MLGLVLVNTSNEIIQSFGNSDFCNHVQSLVCDDGLVENTGANRFSSSSSGVSSLSTSLNPQSSLRLEAVPKIDEEGLLSVLLPLLAMYQSRSEASHNPTNMIHSDLSKFLFEPFGSSHVLVGICGEHYDDSDLEQFVSNCKNVLEFHYGPFVQFLKSDLSSIKRKRVRVERRIQTLLRDMEQGTLKHSMLNLNTLAVSADQFIAYAPQFRKIASEVFAAIGNSHCLFISGGQIVATVSSKQKNCVPIVKLIDAKDINNLLQMSELFSQGSSGGTDSTGSEVAGPSSAASTRTSLQHHIEQIWVHFPRNPCRRQLVNAFLYSLSGDIDLICLNGVDQSAAIHTVVDLLDLLEGAESVTERALFVAKSGDLMQRVSCYLSQFSPKNINKDEHYLFLHNTQRTNTLLKNLWSRLHVEMLKSTQPHSEKRETRPHSASSLWSSQSPFSTLHKWGSNLSLFSNFSHRTSRTNSSVSFPEADQAPLSVQTVAMIKHFQRQLRLVLNELCVYSYMRAKTEKFRLTECAIRKAMDYKVSKSLEPLKAHKFVATRMQAVESLAPIKLGFDMLGYVFYRTDVPFNVHFYPERFNKYFLQSQNTNATSSEFLVARLGTGEFFVQIVGDSTSAQTQPEEKCNNSGSEACLTQPISCMAIFPDMVNTRLALRQTMDLANFLNARVKNLLAVFQ